MIEVKRVYLQTETLGSLYMDGVLLCKTMELPWKDNQRSISCIPEGEYLVTKEPPILANDPSGRKQRDYWHFRFHYVPKRSGVLIHKITYVKDLQGCIGVGLDFKDFNKDGVPDMADSTKALDKLVKTLPDKFTLKISKK
jgi:hypothetical protein